MEEVTISKKIYIELLIASHTAESLLKVIKEKKDNYQTFDYEELKLICTMYLQEDEK